MNSQRSVYANDLDVRARDRYEQKLEYDDGARKLPDPYFMQDGLQIGTNSWPDLTFGDIYQYLIDTPGEMFTTESMKKYKSMDAYR